MTVYDLFEKARSRIAVPNQVFKETRKRLDAIRGMVEEELATLRTIGSGSLTHGTQNNSLNHVGGVLDRRVYEYLGSDGDGPCTIVELSAQSVECR